jgi:hypothetical protein
MTKAPEATEPAKAATNQRHKAALLSTLRSLTAKASLAGSTW